MSLASSFNVFLRLKPSPNLIHLTRTPPAPSFATFAARRGNRNNSITSKHKKEGLIRQQVKKEVENSDDSDPFEVLFGMLEEDLKNLDDELLGIDDDEDDEDISPEELAKLEKELEAAIGESDELMQMLSMGDGENGVIDVGMGMGGEDGDEEGDVELELKDWQLKKLADASRDGRRKTNIKTLAAELGLDREVVMDLIRIPPEVLLALGTSSSLSSPNQKNPVVLEAEYEVLEDVPEVPIKPVSNSGVGFKANKTRRSSSKSRKDIPY